MTATELGADVRIHFDATEGCWTVVPEPGLGPFVAGPAGFVTLVLGGVQVDADVANPTWLVEARFKVGSAQLDPDGVALAERLWGPVLAKVMAEDDRLVEEVIPLDAGRRPARATAAALAHHMAARPDAHDAPSPWALVAGALAGAVGLEIYAESQRSLGQSWLDDQRVQLSRAIRASGGLQAAAVAELGRRLCGMASDPGLEALVSVLEEAAQRAGDIDREVEEGTSALAEGDYLARVLRRWAASQPSASASRRLGAPGRAAPEWLRRDQLSPATLSVPVGLLAGAVEVGWDNDTRTLIAQAELAPSPRKAPALWLRAYEADTGVVVAGQRCMVAEDRLLAKVQLTEPMTATPLDVEITADPGTAPRIGQDAVFREATNNAVLATQLEAHSRHHAAVVAYRRAARRFGDIGDLGLASLAHRCAERAGLRAAATGGADASRLASEADADRDEAERLAGGEAWALEAGRCLTPVLEPSLPAILDGLAGATAAGPRQ